MSVTLSIILVDRQTTICYYIDLSHSVALRYFSSTATFVTTGLLAWLMALDPEYFTPDIFRCNIYKYYSVKT